MTGRQLKVVRLLEPELCLECRFGHRANVEMEDGKKQTMVYCRRLDCDNWDYGSAEPAKSVELESEKNSEPEVIEWEELDDDSGDSTDERRSA